MLLEMTAGELAQYMPPPYAAAFAAMVLLVSVVGCRRCSILLHRRLRRYHRLYYLILRRVRAVYAATVVVVGCIVSGDRIIGYHNWRTAIYTEREKSLLPRIVNPSMDTHPHRVKNDADTIPPLPLQGAVKMVLCAAQLRSDLADSVPPNPP